jgi:trans-2-enoyl-CoA reductase
MANGQVPQLSPSLIMYQQISMHGFNLSQWVSESGAEAYVSMLEAIGELVAADRLNLFTKIVPVTELTQKVLLEAITSHKATPASAGRFRERTVFQFGDEGSANEMCAAAEQPCFRDAAGPPRLRPPRRGLLMRARTLAPPS